MKTPFPKTTFPWDPESLAPSLAVTADWWNQSARLDPLSWEVFEHAEGTQDPALAQGPAQRSGPHRCPACGAIIYSRRHRLCGVCAQPLPSEEMFSESESLRLQRVVEIERERHRQWLAKSASQ